MSAVMPKGVVWPWWRRCGVVLLKEMLDHLRDRRSLWLALIYPLLGPLVVGMLIDLSTESQKSGNSNGPRAVSVAVRGLSYAPELAEYLMHHQVVPVPAAEGEAGSRPPREPVVLEIPSTAAGQDRFAVRMLFDGNNAGSVQIASMVAEQVAGYNRQIGQRLLAAKGLDIGLLQPITLERVHVGRNINVSSLLYNLIPPLVVFMIFLGAVYLALDTTVGERERGTLEPLLTTPVERWELLLGKAGAAFLFTLVTVIINLTAFRLMLSGLANGSEPPPGSLVFLGMFAMALPVMVLAVTIQLVVAALSRSMKEAQIYLGLLPLVPALPGMATAMAPLAPSLAVAVVPVFGQMVMFNRLIAGAPLDLGAAGLSALITLALAAMVFWWATWLYEQERNLVPD